MSIERNKLYPRLLADVGGTNVRFALETAASKIDAVVVQATAQYPSLLLAIRSYLDSQGDLGTRVRHAAIGIANPVSGDLIRMTNHDWSFSIDEMRLALGWHTLTVINDFAALAYAVPHLSADMLQQVGGGQAVPQAPRVLVGPGTGLGVASLVWTPSGERVVAGEGGHVSFAPTTDEQVDLWRFMRMQFEHVSAERLLCGGGLSYIHAFLSGAHVGQGEPRSRTPLRTPLMAPDAITASALDHSDHYCVRAVDLFCALLGSVAGNLALTLGAGGGVYIGGGVVPRLGAAFQASSFRENFEAKGRFGDYLAVIPVYVVHAPYAALSGLSVALNGAL